jgi:imidazolonepropionase-like amidohydrolase
VAKLTLIRGARQLLTLRGPNGPRRGAELQNLGIIQDGALLISGGAIVEVGPSRRVENLRAARDAEEIDASGCVVLPGFVACGMPLVTNSQELSPRAWKVLALQRIEEAIRYGTTAIEAKCAPGSAAAALKTLRVHASLRELDFTLVSTLVTADREQIAIPRLRRLADFAEICGGDPDTVDHARRLGWNVKPGNVEMLDPLRSFPKTESYPPARFLIERGDAIALASSEASPQTAVTLACRALKMTAAEAIAASTINGACAIGRARCVGSIETGKSADLSILGVPDYRELPYHLGVNLVNLVMIRGTVRVQKSEVQWPGR